MTVQPDAVEKPGRDQQKCLDEYGLYELCNAIAQINLGMAANALSGILCGLLDQRLFLALNGAVDGLSAQRDAGG